MKRAVFLDKDGTLVENVPYNVEPSRIRLVDGAIEALLLLSALGYELFVVSNQPGVALGYFPMSALQRVEDHLDDLFLAYGLGLSGCYWCPHHPEGVAEDYALACTCRKPMPGLLYSAAFAHDIDLERSWMVGDILDDIEAGQRAGCRTVLVDAGNETAWKHGPYREPHFRAPDLLTAAALIQAVSHAERTPREAA